MCILYHSQWAAMHKPARFFLTLSERRFHEPVLSLSTHVPVLLAGDLGVGVKGLFEQALLTFNGQ